MTDAPLTAAHAVEQCVSRYPQAITGNPDHLDENRQQTRSSQRPGQDPGNRQKHNAGAPTRPSTIRSAEAVLLTQFAPSGRVTAHRCCQKRNLVGGPVRIVQPHYSPGDGCEVSSS